MSVKAENKRYTGIMSQKKQKIKDVQNIYQAVQKTKLLASYWTWAHIGILKGIQNTTTNFYSAFKPEIEYIAQSDTATEHSN